MKLHYLAFPILLAGCTTLQTQVEINAPARDVRAILYDFADYPKWNPYITKVDGTVAEGNQIFLTLKPEGKPEITGGATILSATEDHLSWEGSGLSGIESGSISMSIPGILSARHDFVIQELGPDRTLFLNTDKMSGAAVPVFDLKPIKAGLDAMNEALKKRAEGQPK
jgi:hypothetical protein